MPGLAHLTPVARVGSPRSLVRPSSVARSEADTSSLRALYSGSCSAAAAAEGLACAPGGAHRPALRQLVSPRRDGSATCRAWGTAVSSAALWEPERPRHRPADRRPPAGRPVHGAIWWERRRSCPSRCPGACPLTRSAMLVARALALKRPRLRIRVSPRAQSGDLAYACGVCFQQRFSPAAHRQVDRMPAASQLSGHVSYGPAAACLPCRPPARSRGEPLPRRSYPLILLRGGALRAFPLVTAPSASAAPAAQPCRTTAGSASSTHRSPSEHNGPPQLPHGGLSAVARMRILSGAF